MFILAIFEPILAWNITSKFKLTVLIFFLSMYTQYFCNSSIFLFKYFQFPIQYSTNISLEVFPDNALSIINFKHQYNQYWFTTRCFDINALSQNLFLVLWKKIFFFFILETISSEIFLLKFYITFLLHCRSWIFHTHLFFEPKSTCLILLVQTSSLSVSFIKNKINKNPVNCFL